LQGIDTKKKKKAGMTLIEVLIAVALFAVVALPLYAMFSNSVKLERRALVESLTTYTAQLMMEEAYGMTAPALLTAFNTGGAKVPYDIGLTDDMEDAVALYYIYFAEPENEFKNLVKVTITVGSEYFEVETTLETIIRPASVL